MSIKIVADSGSDILSLEQVPFSSVPLKIVAGDREFCDSADADVNEMVEYLKEYKGKSGSACPSADEWIDAFDNYDEVICVAMTSALSGSFNSARVAKDMYLEENPDKKVFVLDSLSAGPGMGIIVKKLEELVLVGKNFDEIVEEITEYNKKTNITFIIKSLNNLARNGRVKPTVAVLASVLGISLVCEASSEGTIEPVKKVRGEKGAIREAYKNMKDNGYCGGKVVIDHLNAKDNAEAFLKTIKSEYPNADVAISQTRLLCSFYAEDGGVLIGYEK